MPPSVDSVAYATVIHNPILSRTTSSATFQTAPSHNESFHSLHYDDGSAGSKSLVLLDDSGSITPTQSPRLSARSGSLDTLSNVLNGLPQPQDNAALITNRARGVPRRRKSEGTWFGWDARESRSARSASLTKTRPHEASPPVRSSLDEKIGSESSAESAHEVKVEEAVEVKSQTASQVTIARPNLPSTSQPNTRASSLRASVTATALDGPTGSSRHSVTSTTKLSMPGGAISMQNLTKKWHRSQVGTDQQSQSRDSVKSGLSVQSGKSNPSAWFGRVKRFGRMGKIRDRTVRRTAAMDEFIKSGHEMYEGT